jgi:hypothetical protein
MCHIFIIRSLINYATKGEVLYTREENMKGIIRVILLATVLVGASSPAAFSQQEPPALSQDADVVLVEAPDYPWSSVGDVYAAPLYYRAGHDVKVLVEASDYPWRSVGLEYTAPLYYPAGRTRTAEAETK